MSMRKVIKIFITFIILITMSMQYNTIYAINYKDGGGNGKSTKWTSQSPIWYKPTSEDVGQEEIKDKANIIHRDGVLLFFPIFFDGDGFAVINFQFDFVEYIGIQCFIKNF